MRTGEHLVIDFPQTDSDAGHRVGKPAGFYSELDGVKIGLFAHGDALFVWLDGKILVPGDDLRIEHATSGDRVSLVVRGGGVSRVMEYPKEEPVSTPFYSEVDEDADFGLWLYNVLNSEERRQIFLSSWS